MKTTLRLIPVFLLFFSACSPAPRATHTPQAATVEAAPSPTDMSPPTIGVTTLPQTGSYEMGSPAFVDLWVDPVSGDDARDGASQDSALKTLDSAWGKIPQGETLSA